MSKLEPERLSRPLGKSIENMGAGSSLSAPAVGVHSEGSRNYTTTVIVMHYASEQHDLESREVCTFAFAASILGAQVASCPLPDA